MRNAVILPLVLVVFGCATNNAASGPEPEVELIQLSRVAEGTQYDTGPVTVQYAAEVKITTPDPLRLTRVGLQSIGGGSYSLRPYSQGFNEMIAPGETKSVTFWAPGFVAIQTVAGANGPVTLRGTLDFDRAGKMFQKVVVQNIAPAGGN
jgi:hypothetical protein